MGIFDLLKRKPKVERENSYNNYEVSELDNVDNHLDFEFSSEGTTKSNTPSEMDKYKELFDNSDFQYMISKGLEIDLFLADENTKKQIPRQFLDRCLDTNFLDTLLKNLYSIHPETLKKIIYNTLSLDDLNYDNLSLVALLSSSPRVDTIKNRKVSFDKDSSYVIIEGNDNLSADIREDNIYVDSYFVDSPILARKHKYVNLVSIFNDNDIKIINKSSGKFCKKGYIVNDENILNDDSIIVITFEKYKELSKNPELMEILSTHQLCISDNYDELTELYDIKIDENYYYSMGNRIDYREIETIKLNHIRKVILESSLNEIEKKYLLYNFNVFEVENIAQKLLTSMSLSDLNIITDRFNNLTDDEKTQAFQKENYQIEFFYYKNPRFFELPIENQVDILRNLSDEEFKIVINDPKVSSLFDDKIAEKLDLFSYQQVLNRIKGIEHNQCVKDFVERNGYSLKNIVSNPEFDLKSEYDINKILSDNFISAGTVVKPLSMEDIVGISKWHMRNASNNIIDNFGNFFDASGDGYHTRGLSMLEFKDGQEAMEKLEYSFTNEPLKLEELDGKSIISNNGLHRTMILKFFYMKESSEGVLSKEELKNKYTIPNCIVNQVDIEKTYTSYLIKLFDSNVTGVYKSEKQNCDLIIYMRDKQVLDLAMLEIQEKLKTRLSMADSYEMEQIRKYYSIYPSFKEFIDKNYGEYAACIKESEEVIHGKDI